MFGSRDGRIPGSSLICCWNVPELFALLEAVSVDVARATFESARLTATRMLKRLWREYVLPYKALEVSVRDKHPFEVEVNFFSIFFSS